MRREERTGSLTQGEDFGLVHCDVGHRVPRRACVVPLSLFGC